MHIKRTTTALASLTAAALAAALLPGTGAAAAGRDDLREPAWQRPVSPGAMLPFQVALRGSSIYYSDGGDGTIRRVARGADPVVVRVQGGSVGGVDFSDDRRTMAWTSQSGAGRLLTIRQPGRPLVRANLGSYEFRKNPDRRNTYGIVANGNDCARAAVAELTGLPATYRGIRESNPYQVTALPRRAWAVVDAAGNSIVRVGPKGGITTMAVLPPQRLTFTQAQVDAIGAPDCMVGVTYAFEPVPTDVERGPRGSFYVSTLPGGPEDPSLGARGSVYRITAGGAMSRRASGFLGATNLAVTRTGVVYVTELFKGQVTRLALNNKRVRTAAIETPLSVEVKGSQIFVGAIGQPGQIARFPR